MKLLGLSCLLLAACVLKVYSSKGKPRWGPDLGPPPSGNLTGVVECKTYCDGSDEDGDWGLGGWRSTLKRRIGWWGEEEEFNCDTICYYYDVAK
ncbi:Hypothetical protein NTJ_13705 [Nesidiocoris tenuis]|uniref:Uncharacterized protein n=1 Tax=Nesidiocoris tenuis TaxID=355587 RepID=A0ABN7B929_9HEMI|nr:Hypothetical protein NTJ_13705 [Nesidiocoris tenuis]